MIYLFSDYDKVTPEIYNELLKKLPEKRKKKALRFRHNGGRISCVIGYLIFLYGFRNYCKQEGLPDFAVDVNGKPFLNDYPDVFFNLSHCNGAAAVIFGDKPVGIDIQDRRELNIRQVKKVCSQEEVDRIINATEPDLEFCRIWSVKESLSKLSGKGIFRDIRNLAPHDTNINTVFIEPDKYMTSSTNDKKADFVIHRLNISNLLELN